MQEVSIETALIRRAQKGDQAAFQRLFEMYHNISWRTARVMLADQRAAEDAVQEGWFDAWKNLNKFQANRPFRPWLLTLITNRCHKSIPQTNKLLVPLDQVEVDNLVDDTYKAIHHFIRQETSKQLKEMLSTLSAEHRQVLELRYFADLELTEIALLVGAPTGNVKSRLHRALQAVRTHLNEAKSSYVS